MIKGMLVCLFAGLPFDLKYFREISFVMLKKLLFQYLHKVAHR